LGSLGALEQGNKSSRQHLSLRICTNGIWVSLHRFAVWDLAAPIVQRRHKQRFNLEHSKDRLRTQCGLLERQIEREKEITSRKLTQLSSLPGGLSAIRAKAHNGKA
jgi:hypothetical protein